MVISTLPTVELCAMVVVPVDDRVKSARSSVGYCASAVNVPKERTAIARTASKPISLVFNYTPSLPCYCSLAGIQNINSLPSKKQYIDFRYI